MGDEDVDIERFGGEDPRLGQHRQGRIGPAWIEPSGDFVPGEVSVDDDE
ncbi:hypothetical protein ACLBYD_26735 [Rhodococcus sp. C26F]